MGPEYGRTEPQQERKIMNEIAPGPVETKARERKSAGRIATPIIRILLGLMFLVFGLNGFLNFMPAPKDMPPEILNVLGALTQAGYITVVSGAEVLVALMLLTNRFVPLALALLAPIVVGIITFHIAMAPATIGPGIVVLLMELYLAWVYRDAFRPMLVAKVSPGGTPEVV
jgi:uncharacterized membrane protein YphA (DoxX/SURF4 family)